MFEHRLTMDFVFERPPDFDALAATLREDLTLPLAQEPLQATVPGDVHHRLRGVWHSPYPLDPRLALFLVRQTARTIEPVLYARSHVAVTLLTRAADLQGRFDGPPCQAFAAEAVFGRAVSESRT